MPVRDWPNIFEHRMRPPSAGFAVPVFAFFSAGVTVGGLSGFADSMADRVTIGIVVALVVGKTVGIFGSTVLMARFTGAELDGDHVKVGMLVRSVLSAALAAVVLGRRNRLYRRLSESEAEAERDIVNDRDVG